MCFYFLISTEQFEDIKAKMSILLVYITNFVKYNLVVGGMIDWSEYVETHSSCMGLDNFRKVEGDSLT